MHVIKWRQHQHNNDNAVHLVEVLLESAVLAIADAGRDAAFLPAMPIFFVSAFLSVTDVSRVWMKSAISLSRSGSGFRQ